jgi:putative glutamine amidotransferase
MFDRQGFDGLILTGGNDLGESLVRDDTETELLRRALDRGLPVFAVCRGLQLVQRYFDGTVSACHSDRHVATHHPIQFPPGSADREGGSVVVNSFHAWGVEARHLSPALRAIAVSEDGLIEALGSEDGRLMAVQWHPERQRPHSPLDRLFVRELFGLEP